MGIYGDAMKKRRGTTFRFDRSVDTGPLDRTADPALQETIQKERIRRQVQSRLKLEGTGDAFDKFYNGR